MKHFVLLPLLLLLSPTSQAQPQEELHYRLSYSGLITGYIWKDLADVTMRLAPQTATLRGQAVKRLSMDVTTANYGVAEAIHPLRYHWESLLSEDLQRSLQVTVIDKGESDTHEIFLYDWENNLISGFRKRKQVDVGIPMFDEGPVWQWEKDTKLPVPEFLAPQPAVAPGLSYLLMTHHQPKRLDGDAIDALAMLQRLRWHDFHKQPTTVIQVIHEDEVAPYSATVIGNQMLSVGDCSIIGDKVEISSNDESGEEGLMTMWLSSDEQRVPLRIDVDARLGMLHIQLQSLPATYPAALCGSDSDDIFS